ncbi:DUF3127 domain-containing protein [Polaribacter sp. Hel_I_88]|uniref:DUF3127 domain-containing protein n=1 Tax=Polaribacter sp. Hel_I_88 TaxID=1250006 RepID=UPI0004789DD1|nr:DUF3127 domain-containing protein [Polaribacter sp. Hel_I_88]
MQLKAKLIECLPVQTGTSKNGEWKKQDIIVETYGQYPKKVCITIWGDKINQNILQVGKELIIDFEIESRSYNNRWYTDVKAWKIKQAESTIENIKNDPTPVSFDETQIEEKEDDLPF